MKPVSSIGLKVFLNTNLFGQLKNKVHKNLVIMIKTCIFDEKLGEMKKLQDIDKDKMKMNPLSFTLEIEAGKIIDENDIMIPDEDGNLVSTGVLIEHREYTKIFYSKGAKNMVYKLSPQGKSLYLFVLYGLDAGVDYIQLNKEYYKRVNEVKSDDTYRNAIKELCRFGFLALSVDYSDVYWINPQLFFNGSRIRKYPDKVKVKRIINKEYLK